MKRKNRTDSVYQLISTDSVSKLQNNLVSCLGVSISKSFDVRSSLCSSQSKMLTTTSAFYIHFPSEPESLLSFQLLPNRENTFKNDLITRTDVSGKTHGRPLRAAVRVLFQNSFRY